MKRAGWMAVAALLAAPAAAPAFAKPTKIERESPRKAAAAAARAREMIMAIDFDRLSSDADYAKETVRRMEAARAGVTDAETLVAIDATRVNALLIAGRNEEALAIGARLIGERPDETFLYPMPLWAAMLSSRAAEAVPLLESAARHIADPAALKELRLNLPDALVGPLIQQLAVAKDEPARHRLAEALLTLGWPEPGHSSRAEQLRAIVIEGRLAKGDEAGAQALAADLIEPLQLARLMVTRRYDALFPAGLDRRRRIEEAVAAYDLDTARRLSAAPDDPKLLLERAQLLRALDREEEALALLLPASSDLDGVAAGGAEALWVVNEAAFALAALGRSDEAVAAMAKLLTLDVDQHPDLINMMINHGALLNSVGRYREAAAYGAGLAANATRHASEYGQMWMWESAACGHAMAGDPAAAAPWLAKLEAGSANNRAAHVRALLCLDRLDAAETVMIARLEGDQPESVLLALQDYRPGRPETSVLAKLLRERYDAVKARPAVKAAIDRVGRVIGLPLTKSYWGDV